MMRHRLAPHVFTCLVVLLGSNWHGARAAIDEAQLARARGELRKALKDEPKFVKVHAAEALLEFGIGEDVRRVFEKEQRLHADESPYHIGVWRVLARTSTSDAERKQHTDKILAAYATNKSPDTENAVETLAKLEYHVPKADRAALEKWTEAIPDSRRSFGRWLLAVSGDANDVRRLAELLKDDDAMTRGVAAYGMRFIAAKVPPDVIPLLEAAADSIRAQDPPGHVIGNAFVFTKDPAKAKAYRERLITVARTGTKIEKFEALNCFAARGDAANVPMLIDLMSDPEADVRVNASRALLKIDERLRRHAD
jgi:HEAT repeat protein